MEQILIKNKNKSSKSSGMEQMEQTEEFPKSKSSIINESDSINYDYGTNGTKILIGKKTSNNIPTATIISLCSDIEYVEERMAGIAIGDSYDIRKLYEAQLCELYQKLMIYVEGYGIEKIEKGKIFLLK